MKKINSFAILGVKINELTLAETIDVINYWVENKLKNYVVLTGAHGIMEMQDDPELLQINNCAGLVTPDGMPEVWIGKLKGFKNIGKVYAPEIMMEIYKKGCEKKYRHFLYGGKEGVAEKLAKVIEEKYPGNKVTGYYCPPFRQLTVEEKQSVIKKINDSKADIVWCGLGCPKQERWMNEFRPLVNPSVLIGVGAGFDFLTGEKPLAPYWITRSGFEWFYRIFSDPKRLIRRYGKIVPRFILLNLFEILTGKFFNNYLEVKNEK